MGTSSIHLNFYMCFFFFSLKNPRYNLNIYFLFVWSFMSTRPDLETKEKLTGRGGGDYYDTLPPTSATPNHNSHKHNWNFIECKTTGSKFLGTSLLSGELEFTFQSHNGEYMITCPFLFWAQASTLSFCRILRSAFPWSDVYPTAHSQS